jgi:hypothetical protein
MTLRNLASRSPGTKTGRQALIQQQHFEQKHFEQQQKTSTDAVNSRSMTTPTTVPPNPVSIAVAFPHLPIGDSRIFSPSVQSPTF